MKKSIKKIKEIGIISHSSTIIAGGFVFVSALAWNSTIKVIFREIFGTPDKIIPMLIYSCIVTIIAVIAISYMGKLSKKSY